MSKTEYAWVIQSIDDDGDWYWSDRFQAFVKWYESPTLFKYKHLAQMRIDYLKIEDCKPIKINIEIVGEDDEPNEIN